MNEFPQNPIKTRLGYAQKLGEGISDASGKTTTPQAELRNLPPQSSVSSQNAGKLPPLEDVIDLSKPWPQPGEQPVPGFYKTAQRLNQPNSKHHAQPLDANQGRPDYQGQTPAEYAAAQQRNLANLNHPPVETPAFIESHPAQPLAEQQSGPSSPELRQPYEYDTRHPVVWLDQFLPRYIEEINPNTQIKQIVRTGGHPASDYRQIEAAVTRYQMAPEASKLPPQMKKAFETNPHDGLAYEFAQKAQQLQRELKAGTFTDTAAVKQIKARWEQLRSELSAQTGQRELYTLDLMLGSIFREATA